MSIPVSNGLRRWCARLWVRAWTISFLAIVLLTAATATADEATEKYLSGIELYENGKFEDALADFRVAFQGSESPNARLYIARCLVALGKTAEGYREMDATVALAREKAQLDDKYAPTRDAAAAELVKLEPKVAKIIVALSEQDIGASIQLNGVPLPEENWGKPYAIEPGVVTVAAEAPGRVPAERTLNLDGGDTQTVALTLEKGGDEPIEEGGGVDIGPLRGAGIGVAALGVGGIVAFAITGSMAQSTFDEVTEACGGMTCPPGDTENLDKIDSGKTLQTVANVTLGIGIGLAVGGTLMIIFGGTDDGEAEAGDVAWSVAPSLDGGAYGTLGVSF